MTQVLRQLPKNYDSNLLVGFDTSDDAAVYKISDDLALIQTIDIFPPVVDNPYDYGAIAATNALSDVWAMGGTPKLAMNVLCIPESLDKDIVYEILKGGSDKCMEAGVSVCGGHTIKDSEPKYGLSVSGFVNPKKILTNSGSKPGDVLILTKALGTGILTTAMKAELLSDEQEKELISSMSLLNKKAGEILGSYHVNGLTDVTGFGLAGHAYEMATGSNVTITIDTNNMPLLKGAYEMASDGIIPAGAYSNRDWISCGCYIKESADLALVDIAFDPQTAGGLLISVPEKEAASLINELKSAIPVASAIGYVEEINQIPLVIK